VRSNEQKEFNTKLGNNMLLWHGSRVSNFVGILSQGLRIAPPEAPVSGYLFGKGIYLADMAEKSINYCRSHGQDSALILLIEVNHFLFREHWENQIYY
jgi:poly [ADP-ribose] polymerase